MQEKQEQIIFLFLWHVYCLHHR